MATPAMLKRREPNELAGLSPLSDIPSPKIKRAGPAYEERILTPKDAQFAPMLQTIRGLCEQFASYEPNAAVPRKKVA